MSIIENIKSVASTVQQIDNIELYRKILDVQKEAIDLLEDNRQLRGVINDLDTKLKIKGTVVFDRHAYWLKKDDGKLDGPYCTRCWDVDKNLVRIHETINGCCRCPEKKCENSVEVYPERNYLGSVTSSYNRYL